MDEGKTQEAWRVLRIQSELVDGIEHLTKLGPAVSIYGSARMTEQDKYYDKARQLANRLADNGLHIITGGGPGVMEAANMGGFENPNAKSVGLNITLPFEQTANPHQDIALDFRYFFVRKFMFVKHAVAFVFFPGGFGTLDELFESLTLIQTEKIASFPVVLFGTEYWCGLKGWLEDQILQRGFIDADELSLINIVDSVEEAEEIVMTSFHARMGRTGDNMPENI